MSAFVFFAGNVFVLFEIADALLHAIEHDLSHAIGNAAADQHGYDSGYSCDFYGIQSSLYFARTNSKSQPSFWSCLAR